MRRRLPFLVATVAACGGGPEYFRPTEKLSETSGGYPAASYDIRSRDAQVGQVNVWSSGAYEEESRRGDHVVVHVGLEVENNSQMPIVLDTSKLAMSRVEIDDDRLVDARLLSVQSEDGDLVVGPGRVESFDVYFQVPQTDNPQNLDSFRVRWALRWNGQEYLQYTPFLEMYEYAYAPWYPYYYDPFLYDPFYYGFYYDPFYPRAAYYGYYHLHRPYGYPTRKVVIRRDHRGRY